MNAFAAWDRVPALSVGCGVGVQVAEVCVQALLQDGAKNKVVELVASPSAPNLTPEQWFQDV